MAEQVKVGVIGTSWWADTALLPIFANYKRAKLAAVCGRNRERAEEMATKHAVPQVFTDYRQMIEQGKIDAVAVATPDDTHYEIVMAALDAGLHVLCEKPVALNAQHAKAMYEKAEAASLKHMVLYTWHWLPPIQRFKQLLDGGSIGNIYHGDFQWQSDFWRSGGYHWRANAERANGILGDLGSHMLHLALWTMGDVTAVSARLGFHIQRDGLDGKPLNMANDSARLMLEFVSGAQAQLEISAVAHLVDPMKPNCTLYGEKGTLKSGWTFRDHPTRIISYLRAGFESSLEEIGEEVSLDVSNYFKTHPAGHQFVDSILNDKRIYPGLYEGYKVQQIIDAVLQSHQSGCRVAIMP